MVCGQLLRQEHDIDNKEIMITGHKGFIGSHIYEAVGGAGIDLKDGNDIRTCEFPDDKIIFHCAAQASIPKSFENLEESNSHNVTGTLRILEHARKTGASVVFSSSSSVYEPVSPYAIQKKQCEEWMKFYWTLGVKSVVLRYFNVYGERQEIANDGYALVLSIFLDQHKKNKPFTIVGSGEQRRDFVYVKDVVNANLKAAEFLKTATKFETIDIGTGVNYSVNEVADMIDNRNSHVYLPLRIEPFENKADITKAKKLLFWSPTVTIKEWIKKQI